MINTTLDRMVNASIVAKASNLIMFREDLLLENRVKKIAPLIAATTLTEIPGVKIESINKNNLK